MDENHTILASILLILAAHGVFFSIVQLIQSGLKNFNRILLASIILSFSILLIENVIWMFDYASDFVHVIAMGSPIPFLMGPLAYLYFKTPSSVSEKRIISFGTLFLFCWYSDISPHSILHPLRLNWT
ncbi:MAG: hypothetical protein IPP69_15365 [Flavobacteriales bacterium]|nr:hypothetical protein [Flavobacteriales bacterium]